MESNQSVLIIGNFLSASGNSRGVCEELAGRLPALRVAGADRLEPASKAPSGWRT